VTKGAEKAARTMAQSRFMVKREGSRTLATGLILAAGTFFCSPAGFLVDRFLVSTCNSPRNTQGRCLSGLGNTLL